MIEHDDQISGRIFDRRILSRILPFARPHARLFITATSLLFVLFIIEASTPFLWRFMIDEFASGRTRTGLSTGDAAGLVAVPVLLFLAAVLGIGVLRYFQNKILARGGQEVIFDIRKAVYARIQRQTAGFFDRQSTGRLVTRVTSDVENVAELFTSGLATVVYDVLKVFGVAVLLIWLDWRLGMIAVGLAPLLALVSLWFRGRARDCFREVRTWLGRSNGYLQELVGGIRVVQVFGREEKVVKRFSVITESYLAANVRTVFFFALFFPLVESAIAIDQSGVVVAAGHAVESRRIQPGLYLQFALYLEFLFAPLRELGEKYNVLQSAMASAERIFKLLDEPIAITSPGMDPYRPDRIAGDVQFRNVSFQYNEKARVLTNISFHTAAGEKLALVGATGAGKSTIASLLARFYDATEGEVVIDGVSTRKYDLDVLRGAIGFVPQDLFLFAGTIYDNIALWRPNVTKADVRRAVEAVGVAPFIESLAPAGAQDRLEAGLQSEVAERGVTFSLGQRQLLAFARALAGNPSMIILDEATANVDTETELRVQQGIHALLEGRTAIMIAHRLSTVREATKIAVLHHGELREIGTHDDLLKQNGLYAKLVKLQFESNTGAAREDRGTAPVPG